MPRVSRPQRRAKSGARNTLAERRARISDLIGTIRPLSARSVLATALLGANEPQLHVGELIATAELFGISPGAARTCLSRMASAGELTSANGRYALTGRLLERRQRIDDAARPQDASVQRWGGTWELAIVSLERRAAADRFELRKAASALHLAEMREGVWIRPDNLDPERLAASRAVLDQQCLYFRRAESNISVETVRSLFALEAWSQGAQRLTRAMDDEINAVPGARDDMIAALAYEFALSIAVVRHLQLDPLLSAILVPADWPAAAMRNTYRVLAETFMRRMNQAFR